MDVEDFKWKGWRQEFRNTYGSLKKPITWAIVIPLASVMTYAGFRYTTEAEKVWSLYNELREINDERFDRRNFKDEEIYERLDDLEGRGISVQTDMIKLKRNIDDFCDKFPFRIYDFF